MSLNNKKIIKAAFLWDVGNCDISFMCIDQHFNILLSAKKYHLDAKNLANFKLKTYKVINSFYRQIYLIYKSNPSANFKIEYKILHDVSTETDTYYEPNEKSIYVKKIFLEKYALNKARIMPMMLAQQLRNRLKRPALDIVKKVLKHLRLVKPNRKNNYEYHLWILALHTTKSNYKKIIKRMYANDAKIAKFQYLYKRGQV